MALARYESVAVNLAGDVIPNATVEVRRDQPGRPVVPLWADREGTVALGNPITTDSEGKFAFHVVGGSYYIRVFTGPSQQPLQQYVRRYQAIGTAGERDVEDLASALEAGTATFPNLIALEAFVPTDIGVGGKVTTGADAGFYHYDTVAEEWVFDRPLYDSLARMNVTGGTADAIEAEIATGVADSAVVMLWIEAPGDNTGPVTINGKEVLTASGNSLIAGQWIAGRTYWFSDEGANYKLRTESDVDGIATQVEIWANETLDNKNYAEEWAQSPDPISVDAGGDGVNDKSSKTWAGDSEASAIAAAAAASSTQPELDSRAYAVASYSPVVAPNKIRTAGYASAGDGGGALYKKVVAEPSHGGKLSIMLSDGVTVVWYELAEWIVVAQMLGSDLSGDAPSRAAATLAWRAAVAIGKPFLVPLFADGEPMQITVGVGKDFTSLQAAHDATLGWIFPGQVPKLADTLPIPLNSHPQFVLEFLFTGEMLFDGKGFVYSHPASNRIKVRGETAVGLTVSSLQSVTFTSGVHLIKVRFASFPATGIRAGAAIRVRNPMGTGADVDQLDGIWRVHAVDTPNLDVTLAVFSHEMTSALAITALSSPGSIWVYLHSGIRGINQPPNGAQNGIVDVAPFCVLHADDFYVSGIDGGTNDHETNNFVLRYNAGLYCHGYGGSFEAQRCGIWGLLQSWGNLDNWAACGGDNYGLSSIQSRFDGQGFSASGNLDSNVVAQVGCDMSLVQGNFGGAGNVGIDATGGSKVLVGGKANKCNIGVRTRADARIDCVADMEIKNCTTAPGQRLGLGGRIYLDSITNVTGTFSPPQGLADSRGGGITTTNKASDPGVLKGSTAWNPVSVAKGDQIEQTFAVTGASVGMRVEAWANISTEGLFLRGSVTAAGNVTVYYSNMTSAARDLGLHTVYVKIIPQET